jgi:hypothetical protein
MHDATIRARARELAEARGITAAATVTGISKATLKRWAKAEGWQLHGKRVTPVTGPPPGAERAQEKSDAAHSAHPGSFLDLSRELNRDAALAREVFRAQGQGVLDGTARPQGFRDASVALAVTLDKLHTYGRRDDPGGSHEERLWRVTNYLRDLWPKLEERRRMQLAQEAAERRQGNGHG